MQFQTCDRLTTNQIAIGFYSDWSCFNFGFVWIVSKERFIAQESAQTNAGQSARQVDGNNKFKSFYFTFSDIAN
jgi:hypothetical protein